MRVHIGDRNEHDMLLASFLTVGDYRCMQNVKSHRLSIFACLVPLLCILCKMHAH